MIWNSITFQSQMYASNSNVFKYSKGISWINLPNILFKIKYWETNGVYLLGCTLLMAESCLKSEEMFHLFIQLYPTGCCVPPCGKEIFN